MDASTRDDAAVFRISEDRALVATVDFFAPIADDPYDFGTIAAANALSDIYAMGANPLLALNIVAWPRRPDLLALLGDHDAWSKVQLLVTPDPFLAGQRPIDVLRAGGADSRDRLRRWAASAGEQGG